MSRYYLPLNSFESVKTAAIIVCNHVMMEFIVTAWRRSQQCGKFPLIDSSIGKHSKRAANVFTMNESLMDSQLIQQAITIQCSNADHTAILWRVPHSHTVIIS